MSGKHGGKRPGSGRPKGSLGNGNADIREMIVGALCAVGGVNYLARQAEQNPVAFMGLIGKVLPLQVTGAEGGALLIDFRWADAPIANAVSSETERVADETTATAEITDVAWSEISEC